MRRLTVLIAAIALTGAACGKGEQRPAASGLPLTSTTAATDATASGTLELTAKNIAFSTSALTAAAGTVTIHYDNQDVGTPHDLHLSGQGNDERTEIKPGPITQQLTVTLGPGTYSYVCDVHPVQMKGELTVT